MRGQVFKTGYPINRIIMSIRKRLVSWLDREELSACVQITDLEDTVLATAVENMC